jgi:hypothetical protein
MIELLAFTISEQCSAGCTTATTVATTSMCSELKESYCVFKYLCIVKAALTENLHWGQSYRPNSETPAKFNNHRGIRFDWIEDIGGEFGFLVGETNEEPTLGVKTRMVDFCAFRYEPKVKPVHGRIGQLGPTIEEAGIAVARVEHPFA